MKPEQLFSFSVSASQSRVPLGVASRVRSGFSANVPLQRRYGVLKTLVMHHLVAMVVQQHCRKIDFPDDRRRYRHLPKPALKILLHAPMDEREYIHRRMLSACRKPN